MPVIENWSSHYLLIWASTASRRAGHLRSPSLLFGHGAGDACCEATLRVCNDVLELSASVHDVKIALLREGTAPCHRSVAVRIHGVCAIRGAGLIFSGQSGDPVRVKRARRGCERDETNETAREKVTVTVAVGAVPAFGEINVVSRYVVDAKCT